MRRALAAAACGAAVAAGCGGPAGDLLAIEVGGGPRGDATVRLVIGDDGRARCDGGAERMIANADLIEARELARDVGELADEARSFPGGAPGRRRYVARVREGAVRWSEGGRGLPEALPRIELFALRQQRALCG